MLLNVSSQRKENKNLIKAKVGEPFGLFERIKMRGIGSQKFISSSSNKEIEALFDEQTGLNHCNIELRKKGLIVWFRSKTRSWVVIMPYSTTTVVVSNGRLTLYSQKWKLKFRPASSKKIEHSFIQKILEQKAKMAHGSYHQYP